jgi:homospermidine synthase
MNYERSLMMYQTYRNKGLLIGFGAIEPAHLTVIQQRMKLSGHRWISKGVQQIANLKATNKSNK